LSPAVATGLKELDANGTLGKIAEQYGLDPNRIVT
jgi:polar amino acid transport system substrate-binding protein